VKERKIGWGRGMIGKTRNLKGMCKKGWKEINVQKG
jgi:hypothetical protein